MLLEIEKIDGSQRGVGLLWSLLVGARDAGYPQHVLLHLHQAGCVGDSKQTVRSAPQHTLVQWMDLEISFMITHYLLHVLGQRLLHWDNKVRLSHAGRISISLCSSLNKLYLQKSSFIKAATCFPQPIFYTWKAKNKKNTVVLSTTTFYRKQHCWMIKGINKPNLMLDQEQEHAYSISTNIPPLLTPSCCLWPSSVSQ